MSVPEGDPSRAIEVAEKPSAVVIIVDDVLPGVAPSHHVVDRALELDAKSSWHAPRVTRPGPADYRKIIT
jgi:hypothetical protein